jgi:hypothetical protein
MMEVKEDDEPWWWYNGKMKHGESLRQRAGRIV